MVEVSKNELFIGGYYNYRGNVIRLSDRELKNILDYGGEFEYSPVEITAELLISIGFSERVVCKKCALINTSNECHSGIKNSMAERDAVLANGSWSNCKEERRYTGHYNHKGFTIFKGETIQEWSNENSWNFGNLNWNLNVTVNYMHEVQILLYALIKKEL